MVNNKSLGIFSTKIFFYLAFLIFAGCGKDSAEQAVTAGIEVPVVEVVQKDVPLIREFVGQMKGSVDVEIRARVDGVLQGIHFEEGKEVQEGQLLYTIDPAPLKAKVAEAKGKLAEAETQLAKAVADLKRIKPLAEMKAVSERDLDAAVAQEGTARGSVDAAKASVEAAEIDLSYANLTSPISGTIGLTQAKVGEYVGKAPNPIVLNTVSKLDPINVLVSITERDYLYFSKKKAERVAAGEENKPRKLELLLADNSVYPETGEVTVLDRAIDAQTGTFKLEASFPNVQKILRPGQFAKIRTVAETVPNAVLVPKEAVNEIQGTFRVFVIGDDNAVEVRSVTVGPEVDKKLIIESGLQKGEKVATAALQRLKSGMKVSPTLGSAEG